MCKKILPFILLIINLLSCGEKEGKQPIELRLNQSAISLLEGESQTIVANSQGKDVTKSATWSTSNINIATVVEGKITAIKEGDALIIANYFEATAECNVHVRPIPVATIALDNKEIELKVGERFQITYEILPKNASHKEVSWSSSKEDVVLVDQTGQVQATSAGKAEIWATAGDRTAKCKVTVVIQGGTEDVGEDDEQ